MKKFFVLYSLKQKLTPTLYKTRLTVVKHVRTNKSFKFQQFNTEQNAKQFIQKLTIGTKINQNQNLTQSQITEILKTIKQQPNQQSDTSEKPSYQQEQTWQKPQKPTRWMILSKDHAMRNQQDEHKYDSSYSSSNLRTYDVTSFVKNKENPQKVSTKPQLEKKNQGQKQRQQIQSEQSLVSQQLTTTQDLTQQRGYLNKLNEDSPHVKRSIMPRKIDKQKRQQDKLYYVVWNKNDLSKVFTAKRQEGLQQILLQLEKSNSTEWIHQNITSKQFKLKRGALNFAQQLQRQRKKFVKKMESKKQTQVASQIKTNEQEQERSFEAFQIKNQEKIENSQKQQELLVQQLGKHTQQPVKTEYPQQVTLNTQLNEMNIKKIQEKFSNIQEIIFKVDRKYEQFLVVKAQNVEVNQIEVQVSNFSQNQMSSPAITSKGYQQKFGIQVEEKKDFEVQRQAVLQKLQKQTSEKGVNMQEKQHIDLNQQNIQCRSEALLSQNKKKEKRIFGLKDEYLLQFEVQRVTTKQLQLQTTLKSQNSDKLVEATQDLNIRKLDLLIQYQKTSEQTLIQQIQPQNLQPSKNQPNQAFIGQQSLSINENKKIQPLVQQKIQPLVQPNTNLFKPKLEENHKQPQTQTIEAAQTCITNLNRKKSYIHPFNRAYIRKIIEDYAQRYESQEKQSEKTIDQEEFVIYPSLFSSQSPGFSIGSYRVKNLQSGEIVRQQQLILGQTRKQEGNLLTLAFSLSSLGQFPGKRVKICLNQEMNNSRNYTHRFDKKTMQTKNFLSSIQSRYKKKIEYVV